MVSAIVKCIARPRAAVANPPSSALRPSKPPATPFSTRTGPKPYAAYAWMQAAVMSSTPTSAPAYRIGLRLFIIARTALNLANASPFSKTQLVKFNKSTFKQSHTSQSGEHLLHSLLFCSMYDESPILSYKTYLGVVIH